jgi:signal peptidase I
VSRQRGAGARKQDPGRRKQARRERERRTEKAKGTFGEWVRTLGGALLLALVIRTFVFQTFYVPSGSMLPTLLVGDHVFVNKFVYGIPVPGTDLRLPAFRAPARGDIVVFRAARTPQGDVVPADRRRDARSEDFIKRIVAVPGDTVEWRSEALYVNGEAARQETADEPFADPRGVAKHVVRERNGDCEYHVLDDPGRVSVDRGPFQLEPDRYFLMGDNRDDSYDSRYFGSVRSREIYGPAGRVYWSWDFTGSWGSLLNPLTWWRNLTQRTRWGRIGLGVGCG